MIVPTWVVVAIASFLRENRHKGDTEDWKARNKSSRCQRCRWQEVFTTTTPARSSDKTRGKLVAIGRNPSRCISTGISGTLIAVRSAPLIGHGLSEFGGQLPVSFPP